MNRIFVVLMISLLGFSLNSCSKKSHPSRNPSVTPINGVSSEEVKKSDSMTVTKAVVKKKPKATFPKVITVNDSAANKSVDGRLYYDVMGHRYWRNNKDGKYYLFNKAMYNNDAFKKPD